VSLINPASSEASVVRIFVPLKFLALIRCWNGIQSDLPRSMPLRFVVVVHWTEVPVLIFIRFYLQFEQLWVANLASHSVKIELTQVLL